MIKGENMMIWGWIASYHKKGVLQTRNGYVHHKNSVFYKSKPIFE